MSAPSLHPPLDTPKRLREVYRYLSPSLVGVDVSASYNATNLTSARLPPEGHAPYPSSDAGLTAFAQLGAFRLGAPRALISLIDDERQYVLAEATMGMPLNNAGSHPSYSDLWLGNICIPRQSAICASVLGTAGSPDDKDAVGVAIGDLSKDDSYSSAWYVESGPRLRFYAGVPIFSPGGYKIGAFCVYDSKPRDSVSDEELAILRDLASATMQHIDNHMVREKHRQANQLLEGLASFVRGDDSSAAGRSPTQADSSASRAPLDRQLPLFERSKSAETRLSELASPSIPEPSAQAGTPHRSKPLVVEHADHSKGTQNIFSRAANILCGTCELDGMVILDAVSAKAGRTRRESSQQSSDNNTSDHASSGAYGSGASSPESGHSAAEKRASEDSRGSCDVLGFATEGRSSVSGDTAPTQSQTFAVADLEILLRRHPSGVIINLSSDGDISSTDESDTSPLAARSRRLLRKGASERLAKALVSIAPEARSIAFLPLWDYERMRWFAGMFCWTTSVTRVLSPAELLYLKVFGHSMMSELSRIDAVASDRQKTTFVASISHELRSPLHGILGGVQFLQQSQMPSFQSEMLDSIERCSLTLLDLMNHLLDHANINNLHKQQAASRRLSRASRFSKSSLSRKVTDFDRQVSSASTSVDFSIITEEVVDIVFSAHTFRVNRMHFDDAHWAEQWERSVKTEGANLSPGGEASDRARVSVLIDIHHRDNWVYKSHPGILRRIVMNLFSNALKYTRSGQVKISLHAQTRKSTPGDIVTLIVADTGIGMSEYFMANKLYQPFSQEDSFSVGIGLGLSIVRQLVRSLGGNINVQSQRDLGTEVVVTFPCSPAEPDATTIAHRAALEGIAKRLTGRTIGILDPFPEDTALNENLRVPDLSPAVIRAGSGKMLKTTLHEYFGVEAYVCNRIWDGSNADVVFLTEPSFEALESVRAGFQDRRKAPVAAFLTVDSVEAVALKDDLRVTEGPFPVELIVQPYGPLKLTKALNLLLNRYDSDHSNDESDPVNRSSESASGVIRPPVRSQSLLQSYTGSPASTDLAASGVLPPAPASFQVLLVDDNAINRKLLIAFMKKRGLGYLEVTNGLEAVKAYQAASSAFKVVLMDLSMPVMDGMTATKQIRNYERDNNIRPATIVALTGLASASVRLEAFDSGFDEFLTKPLKFARLVPFLEVLETRDD